MKKLIIAGAVVSVLTVGGIVNAVTNNQPVKENKQSVQRSEAVESSVLHSDTVESPETSAEIKPETVSPVQEQATQTQAQTAPAVVEEPFDAQSYGLGLLNEKARQGVSMNAECYNKLMFDSTGWNMTKAQVDASFAKVLGYSSTCAAYATFQASGNY